MTEVLQARAETGSDDPQWAKCPSCASLVYLKRLERNDHVCPECAHHWRMPVRDRLALLLDDGSFAEFGGDLLPGDPLQFVDSKPYPQRLAAAQRRTGEREAALCCTGTIEGRPLVIAALDFRFMGGSIGGLTGEKIAMAARTALRTRSPLLLISASGGARMQEGVVSLMQLAKTSQEIGRLREAGIACINLNTDPTYGGATASFAMLGDVIIAEPGARIGFAGPEVVAQTIRQSLPDGFQTAEFLLENGMIDMVVPRAGLRPMLGRLLRLYADAATHPAPGTSTPAASTPAATPVAPERPAWDVVRAARNLGRPTTLDYCRSVFEEFVELCGDRVSGDDRAVIGGLARLEGRTVVVIGTQKGHEPVDLVRSNFGMPSPNGYHKARRLMDHASRFGFPVVTFVDTPGAFPGPEAEQRGQGTAIAECILRMSRLKVPAVSIVTGEGGSGGALSLSVANRVLILENAYLSVISPEGCATILWGESAAAARAADVLRLTGPDLLSLGLVDGVVAEPPGGAAADRDATTVAVRAAVSAALAELDGLSPDELVESRYARFARIGGPVEGSRVTTP